MNKIYTRLKQDPREKPAYTIQEAAHYLIVPKATIRYWSVGRGNYKPLIVVPEHSPPQLSFLNLAELHILAAIRRKYVVKMPKVRTALEYLMRSTQNDWERHHPLLSNQFETDGVHLFIKKYGQLINISQNGQLVIKEVISEALHRIERDTSGIPVKLYPFTRNDMEDAPAKIVIDPELSAGRPVIAGTGLATEFIAERYKAGECIRELAQDYQLKEDAIEEAIRCELRTAA